jgi:hypothetical protein
MRVSVLVVSAVEADGAVVPHARICVQSVSSVKSFGVIADKWGVAHISLLPGKYEVKVAAPGYDTFLAQRAVLRSGCVTQVEALLVPPPWE